MSENQLTLAQQVKKTSTRWNPLRKVDTLGQYDFCTCVVMLDSLEANSIKGISLTDLESEHKIDITSYSRLSKSLALAVHEYTHFVDSTSTLWGLRHLRLLNRAYTCNLTDESKFHVMRTFYTHLKRIKLPDYYTTVDDELDASKPWQWAITSGREFRYDGTPGERPIFFVRFLNERSQHIIRSPLSTVSLLETCAMAAEFEATISLLNRIEDDEQRTIQIRLFEKEAMSYLYNKNLTEYSVCAHLVANRFNIPEATIALRAASIIARIVLNSSQSVYKLIVKNIKVFFDTVGLRNGQPEAKAIRRGLENYEPGVLFYVLCVKMEARGLNSISELAMPLMITLAQFGVIYNKNYNETAAQEAESIFQELVTSSNNTIAKIAKAGLDNFTKTVGNYGLMDLHQMNLPPALLGDSTIHKFHNSAENKLKDFDVDDSYFDLINGQLQMESFGDACI